MSNQEFFTPEDLYEDPAARERVKLVALTTAILHGSYIIAHQISNIKINGVDCVSQAERDVMKRFYQS
jgi:hypothetical protein